MDTSTLNLTITTAGVILSGLVGAALTGYFNLKTNKAAHEKEERMWTLERDRIQHDALRNAKRSAYQQLLEDVDGLNLLLTRSLEQFPTAFLPLTARAKEESLTTQISQIMLYIDDQDLEYAVKSVNSRLTVTLGLLNEAFEQQSQPLPNLLAIHNAEMLIHRESVLSGFRGDLRSETPRPSVAG